MDVDVAVAQLHRSLPSQLVQRPGHGLPSGPDHGGQLPVGVAGGDLVAVGCDETLTLQETQDRAREARWDLLVGDVRDPLLRCEEPLPQEARDAESHVRISADETLEVLSPHVDNERGL
jgi:hypothetical protein